jgi:leucyl aminopeptidase
MQENFVTKPVKVVLVNNKTKDKFSDKSILEESKFVAKVGQMFYFSEKRVILVGVEKSGVGKTADPYDRLNLYAIGAGVVGYFEGFRVTDFEISGFCDVFEEQDWNTKSRGLLDFVLGMYQRAWSFDKYLSVDKSTRKEIKVEFGVQEMGLVDSAFTKKLNALTEGMILTRSLVDDIPEKVNPASIQNIIRQELSGLDNVYVDFLSQAQMEEMGMEGILSVGRASRFEPVLVHLKLKLTGVTQHKICLVGKGITYDSGGLDLKVQGFMKTMKMDMAGAATIMGVVKALAQIGLENTEIHWISAFAENMIGGDSYKSDDIITTYSGQTVEVINTDAEGRLTLADALAYATMQDPDCIIDVATLTGACVFAVSDYYTALMGNDRDLKQKLLRVFEAHQERTVDLAMPEILRKSVEGDFSDLINTSKEKTAGHITAGLFLSHFVDQNFFRNPKLVIKNKKAYPWVHLDIAGSAYNEKKNDLKVHGATGQSVRSLVEFVLEQDRQVI